jgi:hypothetical protein
MVVKMIPVMVAPTPNNSAKKADQHHGDGFRLIGVADQGTHARRFDQQQRKAEAESQRDAHGGMACKLEREG